MQIGDAAPVRELQRLHEPWAKGTNTGVDTQHTLLNRRMAQLRCSQSLTVTSSVDSVLALLVATELVSDGRACRPWKNVKPMGAGSEPRRRVCVVSVRVGMRRTEQSPEHTTCSADPFPADA